jgi:hypothetical protein
MPEEEIRGKPAYVNEKNKQYSWIYLVSKKEAVAY